MFFFGSARWTDTCMFSGRSWCTSGFFSGALMRQVTTAPWIQHQAIVMCNPWNYLLDETPFEFRHLTGVKVCWLKLHTGSNCWLVHAMDGTVRSCQSVATSETVKSNSLESHSCKQHYTLLIKKDQRYFPSITLTSVRHFQNRFTFGFSKKSATEHLSCFHQTLTV